MSPCFLDDENIIWCKFFFFVFGFIYKAYVIPNTNRKYNTKGSETSITMFMLIYHITVFI